MFIDMMIATDGAIDTRSGQIVIGLANKGLIQDIQHLLSTMGVASTYTYRGNKHAGVWVLAIPRQFAQKLYPHLTFMEKQILQRLYLLSQLNLIYIHIRTTL